MSLGENIRNARINKKLSQQQLAELISTDEAKFGNTAISNWEKGTSKPDADTLCLLCGALDVDGAGKLIARISRCLTSISGIGALIGLEGAHQLQGAADFTGLLVLILTTAGQQAGTSHSHSSGSAVLQERAAIEF